MIRKQKATILAVDNTATNLYLIQSILEPQGYEVVTALSVEEALKAAREKPPDLVITDMHMPKQSGHDLIRALRGDPHLNRVPIVISSATYPEGVPRDDAKAIQADRIMVGPLEPEILTRVIKHHLGEKE